MASAFRPAYHFSPPQGWINDPNGLVYADGLWHLFYQHTPTQMEWGPMHWGHAVSRDLTHWHHWPIALYPDELGTIFSGSAAVKSAPGEPTELVACFTHHHDTGQSQSLAFSHDGGKTWEKYAHNPVLTLDRSDFRDPKIFRHHDGWVMIVAAGFEARLYASPDLLAWTYLSSVPAPSPDWIWECPDLFEKDGRWVLLASFIVPGQFPEGGHKQLVWVGHFDGTHFTPTTEALPLGFGPDDYAAVTWNNAPHDRRVIIGWMSTWAYAGSTPTTDEGWRGAMNLPREISIRGDRLFQNPAPEVFARRSEPTHFDASGIHFQGDCFEIEADIDISHAQGTEIGFHLRVGDGNGEATRIFYSTQKRELIIDRSTSGQTEFHPAFAASYSAPLQVQNDRLQLRIFVDRCSVEVFAQDGELYGALLIFPDSTSQRIEFKGEGAQIIHGTLYSYENTIG